MTDTWPPHARTGDPETSHVADELLDPTNDVETVVRFFARHHREQGWTVDEIRNFAADELTARRIAALGARWSLTKRVSDATNRGFVEPMINTDGSIMTRYSRANRPQQVLWITNAGRDWLASGAPTAPTRHPPRKPKVPTNDEIAAIDYLRREHDQASPGGWMLLEESQMQHLLEFLKRLDVT